MPREPPVMNSVFPFSDIACLAPLNVRRRLAANAGARHAGLMCLNAAAAAGSFHASMGNMLSTADCLAALTPQLTALGLTVRADGAQTLAGEMESIRAKWWFGGRKVVYRMSCRLAEAERTVHYREAVIERSWGIPPPTLTVETTTTSGWKRSGERKDISAGGGGTVDYARVRDAVERAVTAAGWTFHLDGGRMP